MDTFAVVMPAHNEASGIKGFLHELQLSLGSRVATFIVVDDDSSDSTAEVLRGLRADGLPLTVITNLRNLGHGPSTVKALRAALELGTAVVALDGDGQFCGEDVAALCDEHSRGGWDVVEGVRVGRRDPLFRRVTSRATKTLVRRVCGVTAKDPNTPLRAYSHDALKRLLHELPTAPMTPNLMISAMTRAGTYGYLEAPVRSLPRRGSPDAGTWGRHERLVPSRSFLRFCRAAAREWAVFARTS
jgi:dolichol-phosphate mannosyltransferase